MKKFYFLILCMEKVYFLIFINNIWKKFIFLYFLRNYLYLKNFLIYIKKCIFKD